VDFVTHSTVARSPILICVSGYETLGLAVLLLL